MDVHFDIINKNNGLYDLLSLIIFTYLFHLLGSGDAVFSSASF